MAELRHFLNYLYLSVICDVDAIVTRRESREKLGFSNLRLRRPSDMRKRPPKWAGGRNNLAEESV